MLKLLRWEWETKVKKALIVWISVLIVLYAINLVLQEYMPSVHMLDLYSPAIIEAEGILYFFTNTTAGRFVLLKIVAGMASYACVFLLVRTALSIVWDGNEMKGGYLMFTTPEPTSKILAAKLLASLPLLLIAAVLVPWFAFPQVPVFAWWVFMLIYYTVVMLVFFSTVLEKTVIIGDLDEAERIKTAFIGDIALLFVRAWTIPGLKFVFIGGTVLLLIQVWIIISPGLIEHLIPLLIAVNTALFLASAYLLENKLDVWE